MEKLIDLANKEQRVLIVWVRTQQSEDDYIIEELKGLIETAGGTTIDVVIQNRDRVDNATVVGKGKLQEIKSIVEMLDIDLVVFENELSPSQASNIQEVIPCRIIDRIALILDIFALHAKTLEGKIQVELAQLKYSLPRLNSLNDGLSRQGGGIGTRGPGETKLETNRRTIKNRIHLLNEQIADMTQNRSNARKKREKNQVKTIALVGYTNAGKSRLLNSLTNSDVLSENKLFATLDPTVRSLTLPSGNNVLFIDTVGFIRDIPTGLIAAFKSTLEEAIFSTIILNVCDVSSPNCQQQRDVTLKTLEELKTNSPIITVYNKCDLIDENECVSTENSVFISALKQINLDVLVKMIDEKLFGVATYKEFLIPYDKQKDMYELKNNSTEFSYEYLDSGILVKCKIVNENLDKFMKYVVC